MFMLLVNRNGDDINVHTGPLDARYSQYLLISDFHSKLVVSVFGEEVDEVIAKVEITGRKVTKAILVFCPSCKIKEWCCYHTWVK